MNSKILFLVGSPYQLLNAIILRMSECADADCDIILRPGEGWDEGMLQRLKESGVFNLFYFIEENDNLLNFWNYDVEKQIELVNNPISFFGKEPIEPIYDRLFVAVPHVEWKLIYRLHVMYGRMVEVCMFDEGLRSYTMDIPNTDEAICFQGEYAKNPFIKAVSIFYLHQPELYSVSNYGYELKEIVNLDGFPQIKEKLIEIYGQFDVPKEPYIFIEDYYYGDRHWTNDLDLFLKVADIVGKDNIIVKRHPRCKEDRFTPLGFKVTEGAKVPWEIQLMTKNLSNKLLISITSTAILTPYIIFDANIHVVSLKNMLIGKAFAHTDAGFDQFFYKIAEKVNEKEVFFHMPTSLENLVEIIRYIKIIQSINT